MHAKPDLRVFLKWMIYRSGSVITDVIMLMNNRITKWPWDKFGAPEPDFDWRSIATRIEMPELVEDTDAIRQLVDFPSAERIDVRFYATMGRALIVVFGCDAILTLEDLRRINRSSNWDVMIVNNDEFDTAMDAARRKFSAINDMPNELPGTLIENGILDFDDLSVADPDWLSSLDGMTDELADKLIEYADENGEI